jgi:vitamin B12 transporter
VSKTKLFLLGLLVSASVARAQEIIALDEVIIADNKLELPRAKKTKRVIRLGSKELQAYAGQSVATLINNLSGIEITGSRSVIGQNMNIAARGGNNRQVLILIDGVPINDPSLPNSEFDLRLLNLNDIESIEVVKGPSSVVYGSGAATAVIQINTKKTAGTSSLSLTGSLGSQGGPNDSKGVDQWNNTLSYRTPQSYIELGQTRSAGMSALVNTTEEDIYGRKSIGLGTELKVNKTVLETSARFTEMNAGFDNTYPLEDADFESLAKQLTLNIRSKTTFSPSQSLIVASRYNKSNREIRSSYPVTYRAEAYNLDTYYTNYRSEKFNYLLGVYLHRQQTNFDQLAKSTSLEPYLNSNLTVIEGLSLNTGVRFINHSNYGNDWVYSLGSSYNAEFLGLASKLFIEFGSAFIAPSLSQLFGPFGPNPELLPETNRTTSLGIELVKNKQTEYTLSLYSRSETNRMIYALIDADTYTYQYQNTDEQFNAKGLEVFIRQALTDRLNTTINYTFTELDKEVLRLPKHKLNVQLNSLLDEKSSLGLNYHFVSSRLDTDFSTFENQTLDAYGLVDLSYTRTLSEKASISLRLSNLMNTEFIEIIGFATQGRNLSLGYQVSF